MKHQTDEEILTIQAFIDALEDLRYRRQAQWHGRRHPDGKRFSQEEIATGPYRAYRNLLTGRSQRLPQRQTILEIAEYLEASPKERNRLLLAARYLPEEERLMGIDLALSRELLAIIFEQLEIPALFLSPEYEVKALSPAFLELFGFEMLPDSATILELYFDTRYPIAAQLSAEGSEHQNKDYILMTYLENPRGLLPHATWYQNLRKQAENYLKPNFGEKPDSGASLALQTEDGEDYHLRCLHIAGTPGYSPTIFGCQADDDAAERRLAQLQRVPELHRA